MGQKTHPYSLRLGITKDWQNRWFNLKFFKIWLKEDFEIRKFIENKLRRMGLQAVEIERFGNTLQIVIKTSRPGLIIGRGGGGIEDLKREVDKIINKNRRDFLKSPVLTNSEKERLFKKTDLKIQIEEIHDPESQSMIIGANIAEQIEKRIPFRKAIKQALDKVAAQKLVEGIKIKISGRLNGSEIAREETFYNGKIPLNTLRANIDYSQTTAYCTYGTVGIKVWIYKGETFL